jgi:hypothetical protein
VNDKRADYSETGSLNDVEHGGRASGRRLKMLVAYSADNVRSDTGRMYLEAWARYSGFEVYYVQAVNDSTVPVSLDEFDIVFNSYCVRFCFDNYVSSEWIRKLKAFRGLKIISIQDDYDNTFKTRAAILDCGFDVVLTPMPPEAHRHVYGDAILETRQMVYCLTGFAPVLPADLKPLLPLMQRPLVVGYRGRDIGARYGRMAQLKAEIGAVFENACRERGLACDISVQENARIYGGWFNFLASCRAVLGVDSGSNIFDFDGSIKKTYDEMAAMLGRPPTYPEFEPFTREAETQVSIGEISPRVFEAAAVRTALVMVEGKYSGILTPGEHYIAVKSDFSNLDDVFERLNDGPALEAMTARTYDALIASGRFSYEEAVRGFETVFREAFARKVVKHAERGTKPDDGSIGLAAAMEPHVFVADRVTRLPVNYELYVVERLVRQGETLDYPQDAVPPDLAKVVANRSNGFKALAELAKARADKGLLAKVHLAMSQMDQKRDEAIQWSSGMMAAIDTLPHDDVRRRLAARSIAIQAAAIVEDGFNVEMTKLAPYLAIYPVSEHWPGYSKLYLAVQCRGDVEMARAKQADDRKAFRLWVYQALRGCIRRIVRGLFGELRH